MIKFLIIYSIICIIEVIIFKKIYDDGYIDKVVEKHYGNDAWKEKIKYRLPETDSIFFVLFFTFFISSPILWVMLVFMVLEYIFKKLFVKEETI